jgi:adenylosuccinate lyase
MLNNIYLTNGIIFAQRIMNQLITKGYSREKAYDLIQPIAMHAYNQQLPFKDLLLNNTVITKSLNAKEIDDCFKLGYYFKNINYLYKKVGI